MDAFIQQNTCFLFCSDQFSPAVIICYCSCEATRSKIIQKIYKAVFSIIYSLGKPKKCKHKLFLVDSYASTFAHV